MQRYYVKDAEMIAFSGNTTGTSSGDRPESAKLLLNGHYIKSGDDLVLLIRRFDRGRLFSVDDEIYEKLTIEVHNYTSGEPIRLDSPDIHFYYSSGSSGFIAKGHGVYSTSGSGNIVVRQGEKNKVVVELDIEIWTKPAGPFPFEGGKVEVQGSFSFNEKRFAELSPWLGAAGPSMGKEVYP